jgi:hypothetical protein
MAFRETGSTAVARRHRAFREFAASLALLSLFAAAPVSAQDVPIVNEDCIAVILNRVSQVNADGYYVIPNITVPNGFIRARVVCLQNGTTYRGHTPFRELIPNARTNFGDFTFGDSEPIPVNIVITSQGSTTLTPVLNGTQLVTTGELVNGVMIDLTLATSGTSYASSNPGIATVDEDGFVLAVSSGTVLITATNEGQIATILIHVEFDADADDDGIHDDFEQLNAINPGGANLARLPGAIANSSSALPNHPPSRAHDGNLQTSWFTGIGDAANLRTAPWIELALPQDIDLAQIRMFGNRQSPNGFDFFAGIFTAYDSGDNKSSTRERSPFPSPTAIPRSPWTSTACAASASPRPTTRATSRDSAKSSSSRGPAGKG